MIDLDAIAAKVLKTPEQISAWFDVDDITRHWCRNASDVLAAADGCWFDVQAGSWSVWWIERYAKLYEGEWAGDHMRLRGQAVDSLDWEIPDDFAAASSEFEQRSHDYLSWFWDGKPVDWQYECVMRLFGWLRHSNRWKRSIRRFREASIWVPKKNKKSPTLAALGLHLLCGDGEAGQKVFLGAKDGNQAREIAGKHAVEMLAQSPELGSECTLNKNLMQITHEQTRSIMRPLSSSNSRTQQSKEGLNGSVLIDETHVVDREFMGVISRAGISRSEPLRIEVSTAGNNPDSYGKSRFDYGQRVADGVITDQQLFFAAYCVPAEATDEEIKADPIKFGKLANPAWGHTIDEEEFLADCQRSQASIDEWMRFKMYRLNMWQQSANPWLRKSHWDGCYRDLTLSSWEGSDCVISLDKSKTSDMTAAVVTFWEPGGDHIPMSRDDPTCVFCGQEDDSGECPDARQFWQYPFFWLPEATAQANRDKAPFLDWAASGELELIPGEVIQDGYIKRRIRQLSEAHNILSIWYDTTYCEDITQWMEDELGIERLAVPQNAAKMSAPIANFENLVIRHMLHHNGNRVMTWQAGHACVKRDAGGRQILVKPPTDDIKKIDGMVAGVMGLACALHMSAYRGWSFADGAAM